MTRQSDWLNMHRHAIEMPNIHFYGFVSAHIWLRLLLFIIACDSRIHAMHYWTGTKRDRAGSLNGNEFVVILFRTTIDSARTMRLCIVLGVIF